MLGASFKDVKAKFYDVIVRTDVGNVDVAWSQKEDNDDDLKRLNLARSRELKQLKDEFKDILDEGTQKPSAPAKTKPSCRRRPRVEWSPDKGDARDQRVKPGRRRRPKRPAGPADREAGQQQAAPKKGGSK